MKKKQKKPKKSKGHCYRPGMRPVIPAWCYDAFGQLTEKEVGVLKEAVYNDLALMRMCTWEKGRYGDLLYVLRNLYTMADNVEGGDDFELLATMATAATQALYQMAQRAHETGGPARPEHIEAAMEPLRHAVDTYFAMMETLYRSEQEFARRKARTVNLTKALIEVAVGGTLIVDPHDAVNEELEICGLHGVAYAHGRCCVGYMRRREGRTEWVMPENDSFIVLEKPTLIFLVEKETSKTFKGKENETSQN